MVSLHNAAINLDFIDQADLAFEAKRTFAGLYLDRELFREAETELKFLLGRRGDAIAPKFGWRLNDDLGFAIASQKRFSDALPYLENALALVELTHDKHGKALVMNRLAICLFESEEKERSLALFRQALEIAEEEAFHELAQRIQSNLSWYMSK